MQLEWPFSWCAFCLAAFGVGQSHPHRRTDSHVIPESLGGRLSTTALCFACNSRTGEKWEQTLPVDPTLRAEIERFSDVLGAFERQRSRAGREWVAKTAHGSLKMKRTKHGDWKATDTRQEDGSRLKSGAEGRRELRGRLAAGGLSLEEIKIAIERFERGEDVRVGEFTFKSHTADLELSLPWDADPAHRKAFLSIATHFLAVVVMDGIRTDALEPVRRALAGADREGDDAAWTLLPMQAPRDSEPWHRLLLSEGEPHAVVDVCLFGRWRYLVHFNAVSWSKGRWGVGMDLRSGDLTVRELDAPHAG